MKKYVAMALGVFAAFAMAAGVQAADVINTQFGDLPADGPEINFVIASDADANSVHNKAVEDMIAMVAEETQGKITFTNYPGGQIGGDQELLNSVVAGDIDCQLMSGALAQAIIPESCMFNIPFLNNINDLDAIIKTMSAGEFRDAFGGKYEDAGMKLLVLSLGQSFELNTREKVTTLEELQGLKVRTPQGESYMAVWTALGANPTPLAYSELYTALQQGVVDGSDQFLSNILSVKFYEQAPYIMMTNHNYGCFTIVMNKARYDGLDPEYQAYIDGLGVWMSEYLTRAFAAATDDARAQLEELGVEFYDLTDEQVEEFTAAGAAGVEAVEKMVQNDDMIALYKKVLEENK